MSTLFPYTTLFRSAVNVDEMSAGRYLPEGLVEGCKVTSNIAKDAVITYRDVELPAGRQLDVTIGDDRILGDRKSTRLNSSHLGTSYAVFSLKKKTRTAPWESVTQSGSAHQRDCCKSRPAQE